MLTVAFQLLGVRDLSALARDWRRGRDIVFQVHIFPSLQRDWDIAVHPDEIVKITQRELSAFSPLGIGQHPQDLYLSDLIGDGLAWTGGEKGGFIASRLGIHGNIFFEVIRALSDGEFAGGKLHI